MSFTQTANRLNAKLAMSVGVMKRMGGMPADIIAIKDRLGLLNPTIVDCSTNEDLAGRYVDYPGYAQPGHRTTANLYTTFLNLAGSSAERFGVADPNLKDLDQTGPLEELLA